MVEIDKSKPIFVMHVAAEMIQMHPQTLRKYESFGFVKPTRVHNMRLYSLNDIKRLEQIKTLVAEGVNMAGLKHLVPLVGRDER